MLFLKLSGVPHPATCQRQRQGPKSGAAWSPNKRVAFECSFPFPPIGRPGLGPGTSPGPSHASPYSEPTPGQERAGPSGSFSQVILSWTSPCSSSIPIKGSFLLHPESLVRTPLLEPLGLE